MVDLAKRVSPGFRNILEALDLDGAEGHRGSVYGLWPDLRLAYFNPWWFRFAKENDGEPDIALHWGLGTPVMNSVPDVLKTFYEDLYESVFSRKQPFSVPVQHEYECSSPNTYRRYLMTLYRLGASEGILVVNSIVVEGPQTREPHDALETLYRSDDGVIRQCPSCRRTKNMKETDQWDWVPAWVAKSPSRTTHVMCNLCFQAYFKEQLRE